MQFLSRVAEWLRAQKGWRAYALAFLLGVFYTLAFPPFWLLPLAVVAFSCWFWLLQGCADAKRAFWLSWWFGFGHHTTGLYWICIALGVDGSTFWWLMPFALCVLPAYLSLYIGAMGALFTRVRRKPLEQVLAFALLWLAAEWLRAHLIYGFPWNLAGYIWTVSDVTLQPASLVGAYGMSLWAVLFCASFTLLAPLQHKASALRGFVAVMAISAALALWGQWRLSGAEQALEAPTDVQLRLVQANVEQSLKWDPQFEQQALQRHLDLSMQPAQVMPDYIIWPETAMPYRVEIGAQGTAALAAALPPEAHLITGAVRSEGQGEDWQVWNSLRSVDASAAITMTYDKAVLVPFGEFIPLRGILPVEKVTKGAKDFSAGAGARVVQLGGSAPPVQPLICYEAIFTDFRPDVGEVPAKWLLNVTNDAWFGTSTGPYQHLNMARTRAVERGLPLVRVANTGVSAVFDAFGRKQAALALNQQGVIDTPLPPALIVPSWYSRYGEFTLIIICYILLIYTFRVSSKIV